MAPPNPEFKDKKPPSQDAMPGNHHCGFDFQWKFRAFDFLVKNFRMAQARTVTNPDSAEGLPWTLSVVQRYTPKSNTRKRVPGTICTKIVFSCN
eukprot:542397-Rhodomonas_salina.1